MECKCPSKTHIDGNCVMEHDGYLGDICRVCYRLCQHVIKTSEINVIACGHSSYKTEKSNRLQNLELGEIGIILDEADIELIKTQIHYYCNICKTYIDKPEHTSEPPGIIIECSEAHHVCGCIIQRIFERDNVEIPPKFFKAKQICSTHKHITEGEKLHKAVHEHSTKNINEQPKSDDKK